MQFKAASYEHFHDPQDPVCALRSKQTALAIAESVLSCLMEAGKVQKVQEREKPKTRGVYCVRKRQEKGQACWTFRFGGRENRHSGAYYRTSPRLLGLVKLLVSKQFVTAEAIRG